MKEIPLINSDLVALVDDEDWPALSVYRWRAMVTKSGVYARTRVGRETILLHRKVLGLKVGDKAEADHIHGKTLDCRKSELRKATRGQNRQNSKATRNGFKGAYRFGKYWRSKITCKGESECLGFFSSEFEAALAYDKAARRLFGEFARLNFPLTKESSVALHAVKHRLESLKWVSPRLTELFQRGAQ